MAGAASAYVAPRALAQQPIQEDASPVQAGAARSPEIAGESSDPLLPSLQLLATMGRLRSAADASLQMASGGAGRGCGSWEQIVCHRPAASQ